MFMITNISASAITEIC